MSDLKADLTALRDRWLDWSKYPPLGKRSAGWAFGECADALSDLLRTFPPAESRENSDA